MARPLALSLLLFLLAAASLAQPAPERQTRRRAPDAPLPTATVDEMAWLAGRWTGDGLGGRTEEIWSPPDAGVMMGMFRLIHGDKVAFYEFLTLRAGEQGLTLQLKHFNLDMSGWEEKKDFVEFLYVGREDNRYYFNGLTFVREGDDELTIYLSMRSKDGSVREMPFRMRRQK